MTAIQRKRDSLENFKFTFDASQGEWMMWALEISKSGKLIRFCFQSKYIRSHSLGGQTNCPRESAWKWIYLQESGLSRIQAAEREPTHSTKLNVKSLKRPISPSQRKNNQSAVTESWEHLRELFCLSVWWFISSCRLLWSLNLETSALECRIPHLDASYNSFYLLPHTDRENCREIVDLEKIFKTNISAREPFLSFNTLLQTVYLIEKSDEKH